MARAFVAFSVPPRLRTRLAEEADRLRLLGTPVAWVNPINYHATLRFLGEVRDEDLLTLHPLLEEVISATQAMRLVAKGLRVVPETGTARTVWCGVAGEDEEGDELLQDLHRRLNTGLASAGYRREKGPFLPHVTLGRIRDADAAQVELLREKVGPAVRREFGHFRLDDVVLFESRRMREGMVYTPLHTFPLG
jgi:2'-5' RNA ligase